MNYNEVMSKLESLGTEQNRKIYRKHGASKNLFGVSFANLRKIAKTIKTDHKLAVELWLSENSDAQSLATMIFDPNELTFSTVDKWLKKLDYYLVVGLLSGVVAKTNFYAEAIESWTKSEKEFIKEGGFSLLSSCLKEGRKISPIKLKKFLKQIEKEIHTSKNRAKSAMNNALIAIGVYEESLYEEALATAKKIGKVQVDHGETSCKTPDAYTYIIKSVARR